MLFRGFVDAHRLLCMNNAVTVDLSTCTYMYIYTTGSSRFTHVHAAGDCGVQCIGGCALRAS